MGALDDYLVDPNISLLTKVRIQAQVLVPIMRALRSELGKDKADAIVRSALRDWPDKIFATMRHDIEGSNPRKWAVFQAALPDAAEREVTYETHRQDKEALEFDVTSCRFADFFRALDEPELGALLVCRTDFDIAAVSDGAVSLDRKDTLMQGGPCCTFRYNFETR